MNEHDKKVLTWVTMLTLSAIIVILSLNGVYNLEFKWLLLPASWFVGAVMTWGYGKFIGGPRKRGFDFYAKFRTTKR